MFFKKHKNEILTAVVGFFMLFISFFFNSSQKVAFIIGFIIIFISLLFFIYFKTREKDFYFLSFDRPGQDKDWAGRGKLEFIHSEKCYMITNSDIGYIFSKTAYWNNYKYEFDFKIINNCIAFIVRSVNLSNYVMFQFGFDRVNPHIRLNGQWLVMNNMDSNIDMEFKNKLDPDVWYKGKIVCEKRNVTISIYDYKKKNIIFNRLWEIPEYLSVKFPKKIEEKEAKNANINDDNYVSMVQDIDFDFGAIGLRNWGHEKGFVKNIYIEKL